MRVKRKNTTQKTETIVKRRFNSVADRQWLRNKDVILLTAVLNKYIIIRMICLSYSKSNWRQFVQRLVWHSRKSFWRPTGKAETDTTIDRSSSYALEIILPIIMSAVVVATRKTSTQTFDTRGLWENRSYQRYRFCSPLGTKTSFTTTNGCRVYFNHFGTTRGNIISSHVLGRFIVRHK